MKNLVANIENSLIFHESDSHNDSMFSNFNMILQTITSSKSREDLEKKMSVLFKGHATKKYFEFGFGGNHMWLKQNSIKTYLSDEVGTNFDNRILIYKF